MPLYKIVRRQANNIERALVLLTTACLIGALTFILLNNNLALVFSLLVLFICFSLWILLKQTGVLKRYKVVGSLYLDADRIVVHENRSLQDRAYQLSDYDVTVHFRGRKGQWIGRNYCYGDRNEFRLVNSEGNVRCHFLIETQEQTATLKSLLRQWYKAGIPLKETGLGDRTSLMLETGLSFNELQEKKEQLSLG